MPGTLQLQRFFPLPTRAELPHLRKVSTDDYRRNMRHRASSREIDGTNEIKGWADNDVAAFGFRGNAVRQSRWQRALTSRSLRPVERGYKHIRAESAKFGGDAALGIHLEIKERGGNGGAGSESEKNDEQAAAIGSEQTANDAPEHGSIAGARRAHHSPRKMGAGS